MMAISEEKIQRSREAIAALQDLSRKYADVLGGLDYVSVDDILNFDDGDIGLSEPLADVLTDDDVESILWHVGKHAGGYESAATALPNIIQYVLDDHERKSRAK
jgi:hypothetical protein